MLFAGKTKSGNTHLWPRWWCFFFGGTYEQKGGGYGTVYSIPFRVYRYFRDGFYRHESLIHFIWDQGPYHASFRKRGPSMKSFQQWCLLLALWAIVVIALLIGSPVHAQFAAGSASSSSSSTTTTTTTATQAVAPQILQLPTMAYQAPLAAPVCPTANFGVPMGYGGYGRSFGFNRFGAGFGYGHSVGFRRSFAAPIYGGGFGVGVGAPVYGGFGVGVGVGVPRKQVIRTTPRRQVIRTRF